MSFTSNDYEKLQNLMNESSENRELIQKLLDHQQYTISKISHEIRNPLTLIYSTLQLIETKHPEVSGFEHWNQLLEDTNDTITLLQELSAYNNSEHLHPEMIPLKDFLGRICLSFASSCTDSRVQFTSLIDPDLPDITADKIKLREVFLNLLRNAKDAISDTGSIRLEAVSEENSVKIAVTDTGCGIAPDDLPTIFDPFVTHKSGGTGLGLAIVSRTIAAHSGSIHVDSSLGKGSVFTVILPIT